MADREEEKHLWQEGYKRIAGIDEAGRGPLAGPVVAAAVILPKERDFPFLTDSKKLTPSKRREYYECLISDPDIDFGVGIASHDLIDRINILQATFEAFLLALQHLKTKPDYLLFDGPLFPKTPIASKGIVKGDFHCQNIAAASIIAKVVRDEMMDEYDKKWPEYGFSAHKGYGTKKHSEAIDIYGPCPIHRLSFEPFKGT